MIGKMGRVAPRPLYDAGVRGGGKLAKRARWTLEWLVKLLPVVAPRVIKPIGRTVDVRIYADARTAQGSMVAVAGFPS